MHDDRELDALLDQAPTSYVDEEPDGAMRARITARVAEVAPRPHRMSLFGAVAAFAAAVLLAFLLHPAVHSPVLQAPPAGPSVATVPEPPAVGAGPTRDSVRHSAARTTWRTRPVARRAFVRVHSLPAPGTLTAEESELLKFVAEHPEQARQLLMSTARDNAPLETKEISIAPIHIAALADPEPQRSED